MVFEGSLDKKTCLIPEPLEGGQSIVLLKDMATQISELLELFAGTP